MWAKTGTQKQERTNDLRKARGISNKNNKNITDIKWEKDTNKM